MDRGPVSARALVVAAALLLAACGSPNAGSATDGGTSSPASASPRVQPPPSEQALWVAVYDTALDPQDLSGGRSDILHSLGDALAGDVVISPAGCFEGLPAAVAESEYVLAVQQPQRAYVEALVEQLDGHPMFTGKVTVTCTD
jgi:hypothetical protein